MRTKRTPTKHDAENTGITKDEWYLYAMVWTCFGILCLVLIHRKLSRKKGTWGKNLNSKTVYMFRPGLRPVGGNREGVAKPFNDSKGETECRRFLETVFQAPFPKTRPPFLRNPVTGQNLEIDCYNEDMKLGVEYNGSQHYNYSTFFHKNYEASNNQKYRDELKRRMCQDQGISLIEVPYTIKLSDIGNYLHLKLTQLGYLQ